MIQVEGHKFKKEGEMIGWLDGAQLYDKDGRNLGYFENEKIYRKNGEKVAYLQGDYLHLENGGKIEMEKLHEEVHGGDISDLARGAVWILLGD